MELDKASILAMLPDFLKTLNDQEFKNSLIEAKNNPELLANPMGIFTLVLPKLKEILKKHGFIDENVPQQFFMFVLMNQNDPEIKSLAEKLINSLSSK